MHIFISQAAVTCYVKLRSKLYSILIGIDAYESNPLYGFASDALSMKRFIIHIGTPEHRT